MTTVPAAPGIPYFTPLQSTPAGTAVDPQPDGRPIPKLFQPLTIRGLTFQNRIFVAPLCQYSVVDGLPTHWHIAHLGGIASRGPGLTFTEATAVLPNGRISPQDTGIWSDAHTAAWTPVVQFVHSQNQKIGIQLAHAGRKATTVPPWVPQSKADRPEGPLAREDEGGWPNDVWGPSGGVKFASGYPDPKELTKEGIQEVVEAFRSGAKRAVEAGFDVIEIHSAHGYLLSSFLSPTSNRRTDEYGGSFENRIRLTLEVVDAVRSVIPDTMPLFLRISGTEWLEYIAPNEPQWRSEDTARFAPILAQHGVDLLDVSAGGNDPRQKIRAGEEYQVPFAQAAKEAITAAVASNPSTPRMLVSAVGGLYSGVTAAGVLEAGKADVIFVGRYFQKNPGHVWAMADELGVDITQANQIEWGFRGRGKGGLGWNKSAGAEVKKEGDSKL